MYTSLNRVDATSESGEGVIKNLSVVKNILTADLILDKIQYQVRGTFQLTKIEARSYETKTAIHTVKGPVIAITCQSPERTRKGIAIIQQNPQFELQFESLMLDLDQYLRFYDLQKNQLKIANEQDPLSQQTKTVLQMFGTGSEPRCLQPDSAYEPICTLSAQSNPNLQTSINALNTTRAANFEKQTAIDKLQTANPDLQKNLNACVSELSGLQESLKSLQNQRVTLEAQRDAIISNTTNDKLTYEQIALAVSEQQKQFESLKGQRDSKLKQQELLSTQLADLKKLFASLQTQSSEGADLLVSMQIALDKSRLQLQEILRTLQQMPSSDKIDSALADAQIKLQNSNDLYTQTQSDIQAIVKYKDDIGLQYPKLKTVAELKADTQAQLIILERIQNDISLIFEQVAFQHIYDKYGKSGDTAIWVFFIVALICVVIVVVLRKRKQDALKSAQQGYQPKSAKK